MPKLSDLIKKSKGISKPKEVRIQTPKPKPIQKKSKSKIKTDRDLDKKDLLSRIVSILSEENDSIPIEVFRGFDLFFRIIKER